MRPKLEGCAASTLAVLTARWLAGLGNNYNRSPVPVFENIFLPVLQLILYGIPFPIAFYRFNLLYNINIHSVGVSKSEPNLTPVFFR